MAAIDLLGLRFGKVFLLFPRSSADQVLIGKLCWSETNGHLQALRSEDGPKIGDQLLRVLVLNLHQCLESSYGGLLEQIVVISCHVGNKGGSLPTDHMGMWAWTHSVAASQVSWLEVMWMALGAVMVVRGVGPPFF